MLASKVQAGMPVENVWPWRTFGDAQASAFPPGSGPAHRPTGRVAELRWRSRLDEVLGPHRSPPWECRPAGQGLGVEYRRDAAAPVEDQAGAISEATPVPWWVIPWVGDLLQPMMTLIVGEEYWRLEPKAYEAGQAPNGTGSVHRGVALYGSDGKSRRVFLASRWRLIALDAATGKPIRVSATRGRW